MEHINWGHVIAAFFTGGGIFAGVMKFAASFGEGGFFNPLLKPFINWIQERRKRGEQALIDIGDQLKKHQDQDKADFELVRTAMANGEKNTLLAIQTVGERINDKLVEQLGEIHEKINGVNSVVMETKGRVDTLIEMRRTG